jgi:hypothetical protein
MKISHKHNFVFFANPKSGSSTMRALLDPFSDVSGIPFPEITSDMPFHVHMQPVEAKAAFTKKKWDYDSYFKFATVRNPWARLVSLYEHIYSPKPRYDVSLKAKVMHWFKHMNRPDFKIWLLAVDPNGKGAVSDSHPGARWRQYAAYSIDSYVSDEDGNVLVDEILKLENLGSLLPNVLEKLHLPADAASNIIVRNQRNNGSKYKDYYDEESIEFIKTHYWFEIENFGYQF